MCVHAGCPTPRAPCALMGVDNAQRQSACAWETGIMNRVARIIVATLGSIFGFSGMGHGFFEILQGDVPTEGVFISAIGEAQRMWPHGNEYAVTLIPNFLISGITAMLVGLALIVWSIGFVHRKNGALILLLAGGGVAQILFFPWVYLVRPGSTNPWPGGEGCFPPGFECRLAGCGAGDWLPALRCLSLPCWSPSPASCPP